MNFLRWNHCLCALALVTTLSPAKAAQIAYSVAEFSSVQGQKNWYYGYFEKGLPSGPGYTPDAFELLDRYVPNVDPSLSKWTLTPPPGESYGGYPWIRPTGSHPAGIGPVPQEEIIWSVLRYRSPVSGLITIDYDLGKGNTTVPRGGGVTGRIFIDGRQILSRLITNLDSIGVRGSLTANVTVGSFIDFAVDPLGIKPLVGADSIYSARADGTRFTARISANTNLRATAMSALEPNAVPTPTTLSAVLAGLLLLGYTRRREFTPSPSLLYLASPPGKPSPRLCQRSCRD